MTQGVQNLASAPESNCASDKLKRTAVWAEDDEAVRWAGAFAVYGGHGTTASSTIVYEIEPRKRLGWHTDATEETQYIIAGDGELHMEDVSKHSVEPGSVFVLPSPVKHDLVNVGNETLRAVALFAAAMFTQNFEQRYDAAEESYSRHAKSRGITR